MTREEQFVQWLQIGIITIEPDGSARGPLGWGMDARAVDVLLNRQRSISQIATEIRTQGAQPQTLEHLHVCVLSRHSIQNHDPGDEDRR